MDIFENDIRKKFAIKIHIYTFSFKSQDIRYILRNKQRIYSPFAQEQPLGILIIHYLINFTKKGNESRGWHARLKHMRTFLNCGIFRPTTHTYVYAATKPCDRASNGKTFLYMCCDSEIPECFAKKKALSPFSIRHAMKFVCASCISLCVLT